MSSPSVLDSVTYAAPKSQSLIEQRPITDDKTASNLNPSDQDRGLRKPTDWKGNSGSQMRMEKKRKANEHFSSMRKEGEENVALPFRITTRLQKRRRIESRRTEYRFPIRHDYNLRRLPDQSGPSQYGGRVHGGRHIPSLSSEPLISNEQSPPVTAGPTSVVKPSPSVSGPTQLPKPAQVAPAPFQPPCKTFRENFKVDYHSPQMLEQLKNDEKHHKNKRVYEESVQRHTTINGKQSGQILVSQSNLTDHPKKVQKSEKNGCPTQNIASGFIVDNVGNISEVPAEIPEGKIMEKGGKYMGTNDALKQPAHTVSVRCELCDVKCESQAVYQSHVSGKKHLSKLRHTHDNPTINAQVRQGDNNHQVLSKPVETMSITCELCDVKCDSDVTYQDHVNGRKHLYRLKCGGAQQVLLGAGQKPGSGGLLGHQTPYPPGINAQSNSINSQAQQDDNNPEVLSKPVEISKPAEFVSLTCELCDLKCESLDDYQHHVNGKKHLQRLKCAGAHQVLSGAGQQAGSGGLLGLQSPSPPKIKDQSNANGAQFQPCDNNPLVLSKPVEILKPAEFVSLTCESCDLKCESLVDYQRHVNGKRHLHRLKCAGAQQVLLGAGQKVGSGGQLGHQTPYPPGINAQSNSINSQVQQDDNNPQVLSKPVETSKPAEFVSLTCELCDLKCESLADNQYHMNGKKHLRRLKCAGAHQVLSGASQQAGSGGFLGLQSPNPSKIKAQSNANGAQFQPGDNNSQVISKPVEISKPAEFVSLTCELCDLKCESLADYQYHMNGKKHLRRLKCAGSHQVLSGAGQQAGSGGLLGLQSPNPPKIKDQSNANGAQFQPCDNNPQVLSKPVEISKPAEFVSLTCELCDLKCESLADYQYHMNGKKHLRRLKCAGVHQVLSGAGQQAGSGGLLGLQSPNPPKIKDQSNANGAQFQPCDNNPLVLSLGLQTQSNANNAEIPQGYNNGRVLSKPVKLSKQVKFVPFSCDVCRIKCMSSTAYRRHVNGISHLHRLKFARKHLASRQQLAPGGPLGHQILCPPVLNDLSNTINNQLQRGDGNSLLFAELLMTVLSKTQVSARAPVTCALAAKLPARTSMDGPSYQSQLLQTQVSKFKAHAKIQAPTSMAGPRYQPQLLQTQVSEIQAHVGIEDLSGKTKTELATEAETLSPMSTGGPSYESQLLHTQVSEIKAHVEIENPYGETKTELAVAGDIPEPTCIAGLSYEPQLLHTQVSEIEAHVQMENPSGETKTKLAVASELPEPTSMVGPSYEHQLLQTQVSEIKAHVEMKNLSGETTEVKTNPC